MTILVILAVISALTTSITFVLYVQARMAEKEHKEQVYKDIHFISLFIFVLLGVFILIVLSRK